MRGRGRERERERETERQRDRERERERNRERETERKVDKENKIQSIQDSNSLKIAGLSFTLPAASNPCSN